MKKIGGRRGGGLILQIKFDFLILFFNSWLDILQKNGDIFCVPSDPLAPPPSSACIAL